MTSHPVLTLLAQLTEWDGSAAQAGVLRDAARVSSAQKPPRVDPRPLGLRALLKVRKEYRKSSPSREPAVRLAQNLLADPAEWAIICPLIGDEQLMQWPFEAVQAIDDDEALLWLSVLAHHPVVVTDAIRTFVRTLFFSRCRDVWRPAAEAFAALAVRDAPLRSQLKALWSGCYPTAPGKRWPKSGGLTTARPSWTTGSRYNAASLARHVLVLGTCWLAHGGASDAVAGWRGEALQTMPLPVDDADCSTVLFAMSRFIASSAGADHAGLVDRFAEVGPRPLAQRALRLCLWPDVPAVREARWAALRVPHWSTAPRNQAADLLWEWGQGVAACRAEGCSLAETAMSEASPNARRFVAWCAGARPTQPVDALVEGLGRMTPDHAALRTSADEAAVLCELRWLVGVEAVADLPWSAVARLAGIPALTTAFIEFEGEPTVGEVGRAHLMLLVVACQSRFQSLARDEDVRSVALTLASSQDAALAGQVAVALESMLRMASTDADRIRLLWQLLNRDPPKKTFQDLQKFGRRDLFADADPRGALTDVIQACLVVDEHRDSPQPVLATHITALITAVSNYLSPDEFDASGLAALGASMERVSSWEGAHRGMAYLDRLDQLVLGENHASASEPRGLVGWSNWLRNTKADLQESARMRTALDRLRTALANTDATVELSLIEEVCGQLDCELIHLGWPETLFLSNTLGELAAEAEALDHTLRRLEVAVQSDNEAAVAGFVQDAADVGALPIAAVRQVHAFFLRRFMDPQARRLRRAAKGRTHLPGPLSHRLPLFAAVGGGTFLVLDVGEVWLELVDDQKYGFAGVTVAIVMVASLLLLRSDMYAALGSGVSRWRRLWRLCRLYFYMCLTSGVASCVAMWTLDRVAPTLESFGLWVVWSSLSLFLGVFVGLILQGQSVAR